MPMHSDMNIPWMMSGIEWFEIIIFLFGSLFVFAMLIAFYAKRKYVPKKTDVIAQGWRNWPEARLVMFALPLELLWEIAQFPLYDVWHQNDWGYILYGLAHCTLGDLLILLVIYEVLALLNHNRNWYAINSVLSGGLLFTLLGAGYTIYSEIMNVRIKGTWGYTELMPIVPIIDIGGMPFLQWLLIPPIILWLMRITTSTQPSR